MNEKYIQALYNNLGGQSKFGGYDDFKTLISTNKDYRKTFYDTFGESTLGGFDDFQYLVKKKEVGVPTQEDFLSQELSSFSKTLLSKPPKQKSPLTSKEEDILKEEPPKEERTTTFVGDLGRSLKVGSLKALGGVTGFLQFAAEPALGIFSYAKVDCET